MQALNPDEIRQKIETLATPILDKAGVELVDLTVSLYKSDIVVRFTADLPSGGINIAQCSALNRAIVEAIELDGFLGEEGCSLEFSSPGLDRPMLTLKDFNRNINRPIRVWLQEAVEGKKEHSGKLLSVQADGTLTVLTKKNKTITVSLSQIIKGMLVI